MDIQLEKQPLKEYPKEKVRISKSKPFFINPRAKLVHRPRRIKYMTHLAERKPNTWSPYFSVKAYCGALVCTKGNEELVDRLDDSQIVCHRCEEIATSRGLPMSSEINGSHVHIGRIKAFGCCGSEID